MKASKLPLLKPINPSELSEHALMAIRAARRSSRKLRAEHKRLGLPLVIWKNGKRVKDQP